MKIITAYPVITRGKVINRTQDWSNLDAGSGTQAIKHFQNWSNKVKGTKLSVDGKWGKNTNTAWKSHGPAYEAALQGAMSTGYGIAAGVADSSSGSSSGTQAKQSGQFLNKLSTLWGKAKDSGAVDSGKNILGQTKMGQKVGLGSQQSGSSETTEAPVSGPTPSDEKKGVFTKKNILIASGILVVGIGIYFAVRNK
jgi:hypothetical protein